MGCGMPGPRGPGTHKVFRRNFTMGGHPPSFGRKRKRKFKVMYILVYPCKMLTFWYTGYDKLIVHVQTHASIRHQHVYVHCTHTYPNFPLILTHRKKLMYIMYNCTYISFSRNQLGGRGGADPPPPSNVFVYRYS